MASKIETNSKTFKPRINLNHNIHKILKSYLVTNTFLKEIRETDSSAIESLASSLFSQKLWSEKRSLSLIQAGVSLSFCAVGQWGFSTGHFYFFLWKKVRREGKNSQANWWLKLVHNQSVMISYHWLTDFLNNCIW